MPLRTRIASLPLQPLRTLRPTTTTPRPQLQLQSQHQLQATRPITTQISNLYKKLFNKWTGMSANEHVLDRTEKYADTTDPETAASSRGMEDREAHEGHADREQSQATTERGGLGFERKAKKEHPRAPEPVIGMNDERAQRGQ